MSKKNLELFDSISLKEILNAKKLVSQSIHINGLKLDIGRARGTQKFPNKIKSIL